MKTEKQDEICVCKSSNKELDTASFCCFYLQKALSDGYVFGSNGGVSGSWNKKSPSVNRSDAYVTGKNDLL